MTAVHGFSLLKEQRIPELHSTARLWRHDRTGAELLSLLNQDENKVFGVTLRTPPANSTGVAHILEHSVLCGSRKYPVKEPFVELLKGSLHTFLNAFTFPDKTCYPVAGTNLKDFRNLVDVYLDAVFFPRITEQIYHQEGRHIEMNGPDDPGRFKGVVFNEMKGAYSSPDSVLGEYAQHSLFPDNCYGLDSGGDPERIPDLEYPEFKAFHTTHYHPSNARFYFYGDDPEEQRLATIAACVDQFKSLRVDSAVQPQPAFTAPKRLRRTFAAGAGGKEQGRRRAMLTVNQLLSEAFDPRINLSMHMLEHILIGMPASPLRKALIESGLGEDLAGVGLEAELRQMYFSTGLKGIDPGDAGKIEKIIFHTLEDLAENMPPEAVEAAVNSVEFDLRERNTGSFPRGLSLMLEALVSWLHDRDPMEMLAFEAPLAAIKADIASGKPVFQEMIQKYFLENPHRTILLLEPDEKLQELREKTEKERLAAIVGALGPEGKEELVRETEALKTMQETPDAPEDLALIPRLTLEDLDRENKTIPLDAAAMGETEILYHDLPTDGITYVDLGFDLNALAPDNLPLAPLFGRALLEMGTRKEDFVSLGMRIARKTGGIHPTLLVSPLHHKDGAAARLLLRAKATTDKAGDMFAILRDVLTETVFDDKGPVSPDGAGGKGSDGTRPGARGTPHRGRAHTGPLHRGGTHGGQHHGRRVPHGLAGAGPKNRTTVAPGLGDVGVHPVRSDPPGRDVGEHHPGPAVLHRHGAGTQGVSGRNSSGKGSRGESGRTREQPHSGQGGAHHPGPGELRGQGRKHPRTGVLLPRLPARGAQAHKHLLALGPHPGPGRSLRGLLPLRPGRRGARLRLLPGPESGRDPQDL